MELRERRPSAAVTSSGDACVDASSDHERRRLLSRVIAGRVECGLDAGLREFARAEGVLPLLEWQRAGVAPLRTAAAVTLARRARLSRVLEMLAEAGVPAIVFKGAHLAHTWYPDPALRPHVDSDLLIHPDHVEAAHRVFEASGHRLLPQVTGRYVMSQFHYVDGDFGTGHAYDVHWQVANPAAFRGVLPFDELRARAVRQEAFGAHGLCPALPDALLLACIHRAAHHGATDRLIWLTDVRVMLRAATAAQVDEFCRRADAAGLNAVCHHACARAADLFGDVGVPAALRARAASTSEPTRAYLDAPSRLGELWLDRRALAGWRARATLVREHLFPPVPYMRAVFGARTPLAWGYTVRLVRGARAWATEQKDNKRFSS